MEERREKLTETWTWDRWEEEARKKKTMKEPVRANRRGKTIYESYSKEKRQEKSSGNLECSPEGRSKIVPVQMWCDGYFSTERGKRLSVAL